MISISGAGLIAQVYPVAVLLLLLESGRLRRARGSRRESAFDRFWGYLTLVTSLLSVVAISICVVSVSRSQDVAGFFSWVVIVTGLLLATGVVRFAYELALAAVDQDDEADKRR